LTYFKPLQCDKPESACLAAPSGINLSLVLDTRVLILSDSSPSQLPSLNSSNETLDSQFRTSLHQLKKTDYTYLCLSMVLCLHCESEWN